MDALSELLTELEADLQPAAVAFWQEHPRFGPQPVPAEQIERITPSGWIATTDGQHLNPLHYTPEPSTQNSKLKTQNSPQRRHSRKGHASGWIEERQGNKQRKHPSTSYYYRYYDSDGRKQQQYVQVHLMGQVRQLIDQRCTVEAVLQFIHTHSRYSGKLHHTQEPKV